MNNLLKEINKRVNDESKYSDLKESIDFNQYIKEDKSNYRFTFRKVSLSLSICLVVLICTVFGIKLFTNGNQKSDPIKPVDESLLITNYNEDQSEPTRPISPLYYQIDIEKNQYSYNEEFNITFQIAKRWGTFNGNLNIKIESEVIEVIGADEYIIPNFEDEKYIFTKENKINKTYPVKVVFRVKTLEKLQSFNEINISIKCENNLKEELFEFKRNDDFLYDTGEYIDLREEYSFKYPILTYTDSLGILLGGIGRCKSDIYMQNIYMQNILFYKSINREYEKNILSKKEYAEKLYTYHLNGGYFFRFLSIRSLAEISGTNPVEPYYYIETIRYQSKNFQVYYTLTLPGEMAVARSNDTVNKSRDELSKKLMLLLYNEKKITEEEYYREIEYINSIDLDKIILEDIRPIIYSKIPFDDFDDYVNTIYLEQKIEAE